MKSCKLCILRLSIGLLTLAVAVNLSAAAPGDLDSIFDPGPILWQGFDFPAFKYATVIQPDGKILIGGQFNTVGGTTRNFIARLNTNGSLDTSFTSPFEVLNIGGSPTGEVYDILLQPDGKILVSGFFGVSGQYKTVVRLESNGAIDPSLNVSTNNGSTNFNHIYKMLLQPDGKIIIGSNALESVNGVTTDRLARITSDGALDAPLGVLGGISTSVFGLALQADGKILVGGSFLFTRLNPDGTPDAGFSGPDVGNATVESVAVEPDGQILIGARSRLTVNGTLVDGLIRVNGDGSPDLSFNPPDIRNVWSLYVQSDGKIAVGGSFTINFGLFLSSFGRINPDGSLDFMPRGSGPDNDVFDIARQADGKYLVVGAFENFYEPSGPVPRTGVARILDALSPLAGKIVYDSRRQPAYLEIRSMNADGTNNVALTTSGADFDPSISADGSKIAFTSLRDENLAEEIFIMNGDGTGQTRLTDDNFEDIQPSISADGTKIAFTSLRDGNWEIYTMDANGSNLARITNNSARDDQPSFSPDGSKIAFRSDRDGNQEIYMVDLTTSTQTRFTNNPAVDSEPVFSPDGTKIAFRTLRDGNSEIYIMNADGTRQWNISRDPAIDSNPAFSPDGSRIVFASEPTVGQVEIYVMNWGGSDRVRYTNNSIEDNRPSWGAGSAPPPPPKPPTKLSIAGGNMLIGSPGEGLVLRSPNGTTCIRISIDNNGELTSTAVACP